jgi:glycosyltransferase involved in cell wall biosynthesis
MRVGIVYFRFPVYKGGSHIYDFIESLAKKTDEVVLISTYFPKVKFEKPDNLKIVWVPSLNIPILNDFLFMSLSFFYMLFSKEFRNIDLVNVICARGIPSAYLFRLIFRKPLVCTIELLNNPEVSLTSKICHLIQKFLYSKIKYQKIICWSKYHYEKYLKHWGIKKEAIKFIPNGIDIRKYNPLVDGSEIKNKYSPKENLIVFAKPLYEYNFISAKLLIKSIGILNKKGYKIKLLLGDGKCREQAEEMIKKLKLEGSVNFMPFVPMTEIPKYIAASSIVVLPYLYEATVSRSLLESMSMGKAIITTNIGEPPLVLENMKDAIIAKADEASISESITKLLNDPDLINFLGKNARKKAEDMYSFESVVEKTVSLYDKLLHQ